MVIEGHHRAIVLFSLSVDMDLAACGYFPVEFAFLMLTLHASPSTRRCSWLTLQNEQCFTGTPIFELWSTSHIALSIFWTPLHDDVRVKKVDIMDICASLLRPRRCFQPDLRTWHRSAGCESGLRPREGGPLPPC